MGFITIKPPPFGSEYVKNFLQALWPFANQSYTPEVEQLAPEKWWLEDDPFLLGPGNFSGAFAVKLQGGKTVEADYVSSFPEEVRWPFVRGLPPPVVEKFSLPETTKGQTKNIFHVET